MKLNLFSLNSILLFIMKIEFTKKNYRNIFKHPLMGVTFPIWLRILWMNKFAISLGFIPKVISITFTSLFNTPLHFLEFLIYSRRIKKQEVKEPIFIIGHPRSGTTHLHYLMSKDKSKAFCTLYQGLLPHSFLIGGNLLQRMIAKSIPSTRPQDEVKVSVDSPKEEEFAIATMSGVSYLMTFYFPQFAMKHFEESVLFKSDKRKKQWQKSFKYFIQKLSYYNSGKQLILKSPANTGRIKEILEVFPDAKFVHIHRDPIEVYQSTVRLYEKIIQETSFQEVEREVVDEYIISSYRLMYDKFEKEKSLISAFCFSSISYSELLQNPLQQLQRIYTELGINGFSESKTNFEKEILVTKDYKKNSYSQLSAKKIERLKKEWRLNNDTLN